MSVNARISDEQKFQNKRIEDGGGGRKFQHLIAEEPLFFIKTAGDVKGLKVLVMGCATGGVTPLAKNGAIAYGVDISINALSQLNAAIKQENLAQNAAVCLMDCESMGFKNNTFDLIFFIGVLHHLDIEKNMIECSRVLKPEGRILLSEPLGLHPVINLYRLFTPDYRTAFEHPLKPKDFRLIKQFFNIDIFEPFCIFSVFSLVGLLLAKNKKIYLFLKQKMDSFDRKMVAAFPFLKYWAWSAVIQLRKK